MNRYQVIIKISPQTVEGTPSNDWFEYDFYPDCENLEAAQLWAQGTLAAQREFHPTSDVVLVSVKFFLSLGADSKEPEKKEVKPPPPEGKILSFKRKHA